MRAFLYRGAVALGAALTLAALAVGAAEADRVRQREQLGAPGWVLPGAAVDLDFQNGRYWQAGAPCRSAVTCLTVNRASTHYCQDAQGNWVSVGSNQPCVTNQGLLVEEGRTNYAVNSAFGGASTGSPGNPGSNWGLGALSGIAVSVAALPVVGGLQCIDLAFSGTATGNIFPGMTGTATTAVAGGQKWTLSGSLALAAGSLTNVSAIFLTSTFGGGGNVATSNIASSLTGSLQQFSATGTAPGTITNLGNPFFNIGVAGAVSFTLRICDVELQLSSANGGTGYVSSPMPTTNGGAVTRAQDNVTLTYALPYAPTWTEFLKAMPLAPTNYGVTQTPLQIDEGDNNSRADIDRNANNGFMGWGLAVATVGQNTPSSSSVSSVGAYFKQTFALAANDTAGAINGGAVGTGTGNSIFQPSRTILGANGNFGHQFNGYIGRVAIWPTQRLPNSLVQQLTN